MNPVENHSDHRKFLKNSAQMNNFRTGYFLPEELILDESNKLSLERFKETDQCTVWFVMSSTCSACNLDVIEPFIAEYPRFNYILFYETDDESFPEIVDRFQSIQVIRCSVREIQFQLQFDLFPCVIGINSVGQVVACGLFNDTKKIKTILRPFLKVFYNE